MSFEQTYCIRVTFALDADRSKQEKEQVTEWFLARGITSFVEGFVDNVDMDPQVIDEGMFASMGGDLSPLELYGFDGAELQAIKNDIARAFPDAGFSLSLTSGSTSDWQSGWKDSFKPIHTEKLSVLPPWEPHVFTQRHAIIIDPGMAFGTGQHASTLGCLQFLETLPLHGKTLLDVGTGSGILAIAAKKLGCAHVDAIDNDGDAVRVTDENLRVNHVSVRVWRAEVPHPTLTETYDCIVANILLPVLMEMVPHLVKLLAPNGLVVFAGILTEQAPELIARSAECGLKLRERRDINDWASLLMSV